MSVIGLRRSPLSLSIDLALENPSRRVEDPNSASLQDAIASLQREADTRLGNLDVIPAQISFQAKEAYSFEQAMLDAGISVKYSAVLASGSVGASLRQSSQSQSKTVIVKLFQPMYTISFADDALAAPADFFAGSVSQDDFDQQVRLGTMGPGNQPCYVQSVSYGRMLVYTATSSEAQSSSELKLALEASYGAYSGSANMTQRQRELVSNSSIEVQVFGGTQEDATSTIRDIIRSGDYSGFLRPVPATTAVPLSYRINDMKNRQAAVIGDATKYTIQTCETFNDLRFTISLDKIEIINGGDAEQTFDIEAGVSADRDYYWLLHNPGRLFERAELATLGETAIFEFNVTQESTLDFYVADFGNGTTGRSSWSGNKVFDFPFEFDSNPHTFTMFYTTTDDQYRNTSIELSFTVERELINLP
jgi:thiol-activated cytolysin